MRTITTDDLYKAYTDNYSYLYDRRDEVKGFAALVTAGDEYIKQFPKIVKALAEKTFDFISSGRESAAFALALCELQIV